MNVGLTTSRSADSTEYCIIISETEVEGAIMAVFGGGGVDSQAKAAGPLWRTTRGERETPDTAERMERRVRAAVA
jgi:hypothetical protein